MGILLRGKMMAALRNAYLEGAFTGFGAFEDPQGFDAMLARIPKRGWNVHAKAPFRKSQHVLSYLGRYTHRVGIANSRLIDVGVDHVSFRTRGAAVTTITPVVFLQRLVQHVLPEGFHKIRHYGLYAGAAHVKRLVARNLCGPLPARPLETRTLAEVLLDLSGRDIVHCPRCGALLEKRPLPLPVQRAPPSRALREEHPHTTSRAPHGRAPPIRDPAFCRLSRSHSDRTLIASHRIRPRPRSSTSENARSVPNLVVKSP